MQYGMYWLLTLNGNSDCSTISREGNSFVIEDLIACVGYEVSLRVVNEKGNSTNAATCKMTTETAVNYTIQTIFFTFMMWVWKN